MAQKVAKGKKRVQFDLGPRLVEEIDAEVQARGMVSRAELLKHVWEFYKLARQNPGKPITCSFQGLLTIAHVPAP